MIYKQFSWSIHGNKWAITMQLVPLKCTVFLSYIELPSDDFSYFLFEILSNISHVCFMTCKTYNVYATEWEFSPWKSDWLWTDAENLDESWIFPGFYPTTFLQPVNSSKNSIFNWVLKLNLFKFFQVFFCIFV